MKKYELRLLNKQGAIYTATIYNKLGGYYKELSFWYYTKKEVLYKLRNEHDCVVGRWAE